MRNKGLIFWKRCARLLPGVVLSLAWMPVALAQYTAPTGAGDREIDVAFGRLERTVVENSGANDHRGTPF